MLDERSAEVYTNGRQDTGNVNLDVKGNSYTCSVLCEEIMQTIRGEPMLPWNYYWINFKALA